MFTKGLFEQALGIQSPWYVASLDFNIEAQRLDVHIDFVRGSKFECTTEEETVCSTAYDTVKKKWRHLNFFQHECYLHARVPRIKTKNGIRTCKTPWEGKMNGFTLLFEALILQLCTAMPVLKVSQVVNVNDDKLWQMMKRYVDEALDNMTLEDLKKIGLDETSKAKGHDYITLFVDLISRKIVYITEGKDSQTVADFTSFLSEHGGDPEKITDVSADMSPSFIKGVSENLPNAELTFDKFHILKGINEAVDKVRKAEVKEQCILKNTKFIFLKNHDNLTPNQKVKFDEMTISKIKLKTMRALHIRENFQEIYNSETIEEFEAKLNKWYFWATHSRLEPIKKAAYTIKRHWEGVVRWFSSKINNGVLEGINSVLQATKARARGYKLAENFIAIAYLMEGDIDLNVINPHYSTLS